MEEWKTYKIGEISEVNKSQYSPKENWQNFLYLDTGSITRNQIDSIQTISLATELPSRARRKVVNFDIVYSTVRPNQCHYGILKNPKTNLLVSTGFAVITVNQEVANPLFVYYYLTQDYIIDALQAIAEQSVSAYPSIKPSDIEDVEVYLPPLNIQNTIANILSSLASKIKLNNRINHNLEEQAQALYKSWFVDFEPFKDGKFIESELGMIPEGWRVGSIYEHVNVIYGAPYKSALFNENKNGFPLIRIRDLKDCKPQFYTPELLPNSEFVMSGDIVAGMDADFSPHLWKGETGLLNQRVCKFEPIDKTISNYYVLMLIKPELEFISSYKVGTTVSHLGKADIDRIRVILPPLKIVRDFSIISEQLLQMIIAHSSECRILRTQLNTLLPKLMSGELKINEIDC